MDIEDSRTPRTLIRHIVESKLASTHPKYRMWKRIRSLASEEDVPVVKSDSETSPTPRTLIRNALKEKEADDSSIYIPRRKDLLKMSTDKEPTPAFKRRAIERKRSLRSSRIATPEKPQKDIAESAPRHLDISTPVIPYLLRSFKRKRTTVEEFERGVKEIRQRKLAIATSGGNEQEKLESISPPQDDLPNKVSATETDVRKSDGQKRKQLVATEEAHKPEEVISDAKRENRKSNLSNVSFQGESGTKTERWDSEGLGVDSDKSAVDLVAWIEHSEVRETYKERRDLLDGVESQEKTNAVEYRKEDRTNSLPEAVVIEPEVESEHLNTSEKGILGPLSPGTTKSTEVMIDLQKGSPMEKDAASDHSEQISPSQDEISVSEDSFFQALEANEDDAEEVIPLVKAKKADRTKKQRKTSHPPRLPSSLTRRLFQHFSGMRVSREALDAVESCCDAYFEQLTNDLLAYSNHAGRKAIEPQDVELLLRRQGFITNERSLYALVEKHLPLEYRQEMIPMATANNVIIPKK